MVHDRFFGMDGCLSRGHKFELVARKSLEDQGYETQKSTMEDDIYAHVDFWAVGKDGKAYGFDAKAMKSLSRGNPLQDEWAFVEWCNVYGNPGWLVKGCDILVFERLSEIVLVKREDLLEFCRRCTDMSVRAPSAAFAKYCCYTRPQRKDLISMFRFVDLDIPVRRFPKSQEISDRV